MIKLSFLDNGWWIKGILALQITIATVTVFTSLDLQYHLGQNPKTPAIFQPLRPGDQVRRFEPSQLPDLVPTELDTDTVLPTREPKLIPERIYTERLTFTPSLDKTFGPTLFVKGEFEEGDAERFERFLTTSSRKFETI